jgi:hypothetical protein
MSSCWGQLTIEMTQEIFVAWFKSTCLNLLRKLNLTNIIIFQILPILLLVSLKSLAGFGLEQQRNLRDFNTFYVRKTSML